MTAPELSNGAAAPAEGGKAEKQSQKTQKTAGKGKAHESSVEPQHNNSVNGSTKANESAPNGRTNSSSGNNNNSTSTTGNKSGEGGGSSANSRYGRRRNNNNYNGRGAYNGSRGGGGGRGRRGGRYNDNGAAGGSSNRGSGDEFNGGAGSISNEEEENEEQTHGRGSSGEGRPNGTNAREGGGNGSGSGKREGKQHQKGSSSGGGSSSPSGTPPTIGHPDFPDAKVLLISSKRPKSFLERTARELLAGGTDHIILSALGDAVLLCVQLQNALTEKKAATALKIETTYTAYNTRNYYTVSYTPGLRIVMKKHPDFKGSRISPGYVSFYQYRDFHTPCYEANPSERIASVASGDYSLSLGGVGVSGAFADVLGDYGHDVSSYQTLFQDLLKTAVTQNAGKTDSEVRSIPMEKLEKDYRNVKMALCRPLNELSHLHPSGATGAVFIIIFDKKYPFDDDQNMGMIYVVGPEGSEFKSKEDFVDGVHATAVNLMTALCDYNGLVKREGNRKPYPLRMTSCRVCLFSGGTKRHPQATKLEVAQAIFGGLAEGYRHGPSPRINFSYDEDVFQRVWVETTGLEGTQTQANGTSHDSEDH